MAKTKDVADFMRVDWPDMERVSADVHARALAVKDKHMLLMAKTTAKLDAQDLAMRDLEALVQEA